MKPSKQRDELAAKAMHGILCACSSPQFRDKILSYCERTKTSETKEIARAAYEYADAMIAEGKRK